MCALFRTRNETTTVGARSNPLTTGSSFCAFTDHLQAKKKQTEQKYTKNIQSRPGIVSLGKEKPLSERGSCGKFHFQA